MITNEETVAADSSTSERAPKTGSPIIIGGGGGPGITPKPVFCEFDEGVYIDPDPEGNPRRKKFQNLDKPILSLKLKIETPSVDIPTILQTVVDISTTLQNPNGKIEVTCPRDDNDLKIIGNRLGIEFHTGTYYVRQQGTDVRESDDSRASRLKIDFPGFDFDRTLTTEDKWELQVNYVGLALE